MEQSINQSNSGNLDKKLEILLYIPNIIGYVRLMLLVIAWFYIEYPIVFLFFYIPSAVLDAIDGYAARKLNQISAFGTWLDVVVDIFGRGIIWCYAGKFGYVVPAWEWIVFAANHARSGTGQWKMKYNDAPFIVQRIMDKGFKTRLGALVILGIHGLPVWVFMELHLSQLTLCTPILSFCIFCLLLYGRLLGLFAEMWSVYVHIYNLLEQ